MHRIGRLPLATLILTMCLQDSVSRNCDVEFTDVPSKTYQADFVFEAIVHRLPPSRGSGGRGSKERSIVRFRVTEVLKGTLEKEANTDRYRTISVGRFGATADPKRCVAPLPQLGSRHVLFLRSAETDIALRLGTVEGGDVVVSSPDFVLSGFPEPLSKEVISSVRRSSEKKFARKPTVKMSTKNLTFEQGKVARVQCVVAGRPKPKVNWFKDNVPIQSNNRISFQDSKRGSTLVIRRLSPPDSGIYRCQAVNVVNRTSLESTKGVFVSIVSPITTSATTTTTTTTATPTEAPVVSTKPHSELCVDASDYCFNGGICYVVPALGDRKFCACAKDYIGSRCDEKDTGHNARLVSGRGVTGNTKKRRVLPLRRYAM